MAAKKLTVGEQERLLTMLADGVKQSSIANEFSIADSTVDYYAKTHREHIQRIAQERADLALTQGLALRGNRKKKLEKLAAALEAKLGEDFAFANGNSLPMVKEWRDTLAQIRLELKDIEPDKPQQLNVTGDIEVRRTIVHKTG